VRKIKGLRIKTCRCLYEQDEKSIAWKIVIEQMLGTKRKKNMKK